MSENNKRSGFFGGLFELLELASRLSENDAVHREGKFGGNGVAGHWSVNVRLGTPAGRVVNAAPGKTEAPTVEPEVTASPYLEIHDEGAVVRVIAFLPEGAGEAGNFSVENDVLTYHNPGNDGHSEWLFPCVVEREPIRKTVRGNMLVMDFRKAGDLDA